MIDIIGEYLVKIGFTTDKQTGENVLKDANKLLDALKKLLDKFLGGAGKDVDQWAKTTGGVINGVLQTIGKGVLSLEAIIAGALLAIGAAVTALLAKIMNDAARTDIQVQLFARRLFTTVENARSLKAVMDSMGVKSIEELNEIGLNPELRKQFLELRAVAGSLQFGSDQREGLRNIRAVGFEFQKLGLIMDNFWNRLGADLGIALEGPLKEIQRVMAGFNDFLRDSLPAATKNIAAAFGILGDVLDIFNQISRILGELQNQFPIAKDFFDGLKDVLSDIIPLIHLVLRAVNNSLGRVHGSDIAKGAGDLYKTGEGLFQKIAEYAQKIYDLINMIWNTVSRPFKDLGAVVDKFKKDTGNVIQDVVKHPEKILQTIIPPAAAYIIPKAGQAIKNTLFGSDKVKATTTEQFLRGQAARFGVRVTSGSGGHHNRGSLHYTGEAIDVDHRKVTPAIIRAWEAAGIKVRDERRHPAGQAVWGGPHYHLEFRAAQLARMFQQQKTVKTAPPSQPASETKKEVEGRVVNQTISINVNGAGDPMAVAAAINSRLAEINGMSIRNMQGSFA
jgi:hypothetical protein